MPKPHDDPDRLNVMLAIEAFEAIERLVAGRVIATCVAVPNKGHTILETAKLELHTESDLSLIDVLVFLKDLLQCEYAQNVLSADAEALCLNVLDLESDILTTDGFDYGANQVKDPPEQNPGNVKQVSKMNFGDKEGTLRAIVDSCLRNKLIIPQQNRILDFGSLCLGMNWETLEDIADNVPTMPLESFSLLVNFLIQENIGSVELKKVIFA